MSGHWTSTILTYHTWGQFGMQCLNGLDLSEQISKWTCWICGVPVCQAGADNQAIILDERFSVTPLKCLCVPHLKQEGMAHQELVAHPNALPNDLWQCLWRHSDCYNLRKVQMMLKGRVLIVQLSTQKHWDATLVPALLWFLEKWQNWTRWSRSISSCYWEIKSRLHIMHRERSTMRIQRMPGRLILQGSYLAPNCLSTHLMLFVIA
jgi:hypothetical protein